MLAGYVATAALFLTVIALIALSPSKKARLPPGPPPLPVIGNILDLTSHEQWRKVLEWGKHYGDMIYGYHVTANNDPYVKNSQEFMEVSSYAMAGGWVVDFFPLVRYIPGLSFRKTAARWKAKIADWVEKPHQMFKDLPDSPEKRNSFCGMLLLNDEGKIAYESEYEHRVKWLATSMYGPGSDTVYVVRRLTSITAHLSYQTVITLSMPSLALCHHPEVLQKAHEQLDEVLGLDRLPTLDDRPHGGVTETMQSVAPPHILTQDNHYRVYDLPEGSFCVANMWAILHDETLYPDPLAFSPERFESMNAGRSDSVRPAEPYNYAGGVHFADQSLFLAFASILACFDISPLAEANTGKLLLPPLEFAGGAFRCDLLLSGCNQPLEPDPWFIGRHPTPFKCKIVPRRAETAALIEAAIVSSVLSHPHTRLLRHMARALGRAIGHRLCAGVC
ncbi:cytochrome P450 [Cubamyces menziesii]|nr:cytochrome P450 [Cubamyces menziesii]